MVQSPVSPDTLNADTVTITVEPRHIPQGHTEDLGPISDTSPDSWRYNHETINQYYRNRLPQVIGRLINVCSFCRRIVVG